MSCSVKKKKSYNQYSPSSPESSPLNFSNHLYIFTYIFTPFFFLFLLLLHFCFCFFVYKKKKNINNLLFKYRTAITSALPFNSIPNQPMSYIIYTFTNFFFLISYYYYYYYLLLLLLLPLSLSLYIYIYKTKEYLIYTDRQLVHFFLY